MGRNRTAALVGNAYYANIRQVHITGGTVTGTDYVGALVGLFNNGLVGQSSGQLATSGNASVGGLIGETYYSRLEALIFNGTVTGNYYLGGIVGFAQQSLLRTGYATGTISGTSDFVAGISGGDYLTVIENVFVSIQVTGVTSSNDVGFISGVPGSYISNAYFHTSSSCLNSGTGNCNATGAGNPIDTIAFPTYFENTANPPFNEWNFAGSWKTESGQFPQFDISELSDTWGDCSSHLADSPFAGGDGTQSNSYIICTPAQLYGMEGSVALRKMHYVIKQDLNFLDLPGNETPISEFWGVLDGQGHILANLTIKSPGFNGLFEEIDSALVMSLKFTNISISGGSESGAVVGYISWDPETSAAIRGIGVESGSISGNLYVGGVAGKINDDHISYSYNKAAINNLTGVGAGGIVGFSNQGPVVQCYNTGTITGIDRIGGIMGVPEFSQAIISDSFSTGAVYTAGAATNSGGRLMGIEGSTPINSFVELNGTCDQCDNMGGTEVDLAANPNWFFQSINTPFTVSSSPVWDFTSDWAQDYPIPMSLPVLRIFKNP